MEIYKYQYSLKIYKYQYSLNEGRSSFAIPLFSKLLKVGVQNGHITFWFRVDPFETRVETFSFFICPTGGEVPTAYQGDDCYIDTVFDGPYVWHVFSNC